MSRAVSAMFVVLVGLLVAAPVRAELVAKPARFSTIDGVKIVGDYYPADAESGRVPAVILLHMYASDRTAWKPLIPKLHEAGFAVLAFDLRGHGESILPLSMRLGERMRARAPELFSNMHEDVAAGYVWLAEQPGVDSSQLGLIGASVGCSVALDYAARDRSVDAVVCLTPGTDYLGIDSLKHTKQIKGRAILFMATDGERKASDALAEANSKCETRVVGPGIVHGTRMLGDMADVEDQVVAFVAKHVPTGEGNRVAAAVGGDKYFAVGSAEDIKLDPKERRLFSSVAEARARGLTGPDSAVDGRMIDAVDHADVFDLPSPKTPKTEERDEASP